MGGVSTITNYLFVAATLQVLLLDVVFARPHDGNPKLIATVEACNVTAYHELCVQTLAPFSEGSHSTPYLWARAGVVVSIWEVETLYRYILRVKKSGPKDRQVIEAINGCVDDIHDSRSQLRRSLQLLRNLNSTKFEEQMTDVIEGLSAALTDDTCMLGDDEGGGSSILKNMESMVANSSMLTSNALDLASNLYSSGFPNR